MNCTVAYGTGAFAAVTTTPATLMPRRMVMRMGEDAPFASIAVIPDVADAYDAWRARKR